MSERATKPTLEQVLYACGSALEDRQDYPALEAFNEMETDIVHRYNVHEQLVEALRYAAQCVNKDVMVYDKGDHGKRVYVADAIEAALKAA